MQQCAFGRPVEEIIPDCGGTMSLVSSASVAGGSAPWRAL